VAAIDVAGAGGTSWSQVEMFRAPDDHFARVAAAFRDWGIPTAKAIEMVHNTAPNLPIFASGGLHDGVDIAKCLALGATLGGMAGPFLKAAAQSQQAVANLIGVLTQQVRICMFASGAQNLDKLHAIRLIDDQPSSV
jgi:isopentenyl-diphosphate Delta-isomerase